MPTIKLTDSRKLENLQNLHVALWLLKDCAWCQLWTKTGIVMAAPTLLLSFCIALGTAENRLPDLIHNLAVCLWITANITWMTGEFFYSRWDSRLGKVYSSWDWLSSSSTTCSRWHPGSAQKRMPQFSKIPAHLSCLPSYLLGISHRYNPITSGNYQRRFRPLCNATAPRRHSSTAVFTLQFCIPASGE